MNYGDIHPSVIQDTLTAWKEGLLSKAEARAVILSALPPAKTIADAQARITESS